MSAKKIIFVIVLLIINHVVVAQDTLAVKGFIRALKYIEADISINLSKSFYDNYGMDTLISIRANISDDEIQNNALLVLCDILKKQYKASENCAVLFGKNLPLLQGVRDSIQSVQKSETFKGYKLKYNDTTQNVGKGYLLKFSQLVNNTLMAQVGYSSNFKKGFGVGETTIYYFIFDDNLFIDKVYMGSKTYN
ncbi:MAG: hypothetical protein ACOCXH_11775 [Cyclobacteriaceae bacterium]